jgi:hypothetical protein
LQVEQEIVDQIKNRAIDPQVVVSLVTQNSSLINVIGEGEWGNGIQSDWPHPGVAVGGTPARRDHPGRRAQGSGTGYLGGARAKLATGPRLRSAFGKAELLHRCDNALKRLRVFSTRRGSP